MIPFWKKTDKHSKPQSAQKRKQNTKPAVPRTAQQSIPMQRMFEDGTCRVKPNYYTRTIQYQDINYQLAQQEDKTAIFEEWCSFLNLFDSSIKFEPKDAVKDPAKSQAIPAEADKAGIKVRANQARVYLVKDEQGNVTQVVLPMYGRGLWSTMYGFVSVAPDANTIKGITYYDQGETAGLGGEIANPRWQAQFVDKKLFDEQGNQKFKIYKGSSAADKEHGVDGLSGATLTSNGVQGSFDYWFSQNGFGPFLAKFKAGEIK